MCIEFPETDQQLKHWAIWRRNGCNLKELGFPSSSSHTRPFGSGGGNQDIPDDPDAERVDKLVADLSKTYDEIYKVLLSKYFYGDNDRDGSVNCCISKTKYQSYIKIAVSWIDRGLFILE